MRKNYGIVVALALTVALGQDAAERKERKDTSPHEERFVQANGIKINYLDWGGDGEPLIFLTGYGATAHVFDDLAPRFNGRFHVLAFTRRGRAPTERTPSGYDLKTLTSDLRGFLDALGLRRVHLAGHSFGGTEMTEFAALQPERVISLVYLDAAPDAASGDALMKAAPFPTPKPPPGTPYSQVLEWWTSYTPDFTRLRSPALAFYAVPDRNPYTSGATDEAVRERGEEFWRARWSPMIRRTAERFGRDAPSGQVVVLEGASHYLFRDEEERVVREMEEFYGSIGDRN